MMQSSPIILYLHLPKVGGSTFEKVIYAHLHTDQNNVIDCFGDKFHLIYSGVYHFKPNLSAGFFKEKKFVLSDKVKNILSRADLKAVLGHSWFGIHKYVNKPYTYITLIRNPIERIVSLYYHLQTWPWVKEWEPESSEGMSLEEFVIKAPYSEIDNDQTRRLSGCDPEIGQCTPLLLEKAKENLRQHFSVVGVTERFNETLILLKRTFGWEQKICYYPELVNTNRPAITLLPQKTIDLILSRNEWDFELYQFAQEILEESISLQDSSFDDEVESLKSSIQSQAWYNQNFSGRL